MTIKLDISKAYDKVEWSYLELVMLKMGFSNCWIKLLMLCVTTAFHSIIVTGESKGMIKPSQGICQGDPLSPFLFLLCTEGLHGLIRNAAAQGDIKGYSIGRNSLRLTHILFAENSLLFCRATNLECQKNLGTLETYERCLGQTPIGPLHGD